MKIAIFTQNLDFGGVQKSVSSVANYLSKFYKVSLILGEDNKPIRYNVSNKIDIFSIKTLPLKFFGKKVGINLFNYRVEELNKFLTTVSPDVVLSFEDYNNFILFNSQFKCVKVPSVRVHPDIYKNNVVHFLTEDFYFKNYSNYSKYRTIVVSKAIQKFIPNSIVIHNGIDKLKFLKSPYTNYILNVGRVHPQKGQVDLIKAFNKIKDEIDHKLIIVGDGPFRDKLENLINELGLNDRVIITGYDNPLKYYKDASLFVFPSYFEGCPNALLEAMKAEIPVVSYDFQGSEEFLRERVKVGDVSGLAEKMVLYLKDRDEKQRNIEWCKNMIKKFDINTMLKKYKQVIEKCVGF